MGKRERDEAGMGKGGNKGTGYGKGRRNGKQEREGKRGNLLHSCRGGMDGPV